jgi:hypothetical protein
MIVRYAKRGGSRAVPLDVETLQAIIDWMKSRSAAATEHLLLSLPRTGCWGPLSTRDIARIVARHARPPTCLTIGDRRTFMPTCSLCRRRSERPAQLR